MHILTPARTHGCTEPCTDRRTDGRYGICACANIHMLKHVCEHTNIEVRSKKLEVRSKKLEVRNKETPGPTHVPVRMHDRVRMHTRSHTLARTYVHAEVNTNEYACKRTCARLHVRLLSDLGTSGLGCLYAHSHTRTHARMHRAMHRQTYGRTVWYLRMRKHTHAQACM